MKLPRCITGEDPLYHTTVERLAELVSFQISLYDEGESERDIKTAAQYAACKKWLKWALR